MQKWEYLILSLDREKPQFRTNFSNFVAEISGKKMTENEFFEYMDTLGENGWELVSTSSIAYYQDFSGMTSNIYYYFKR